MSKDVKGSYSQPHREDCVAVKEVEKGNWRTPWTLSDIQIKWLDEDEEIHFKDKIEAQIAVIRCNDPECSGKIAVPSIKIEEILPNRIEEVIEE